jgi:polar amino acid transport system substrate-binding protein
VTRLIALAVALVTSLAAPAAAETTLDKIARTGVLTIGVRTDSPPFGFINRSNEWVGFSIDLVEQGVKPAIEKKIGKPIKVDKKESTPPTSIPLLASNAVDLIAGSMTHTRTRAESVDFSLTFFVTGAQFLVKQGSPIRGLETIGGRRVAVQQGSPNARILRERVPNVQLREFPDHATAFEALARGHVDAYTNDGVQLAGLVAKAPNPGDWQIVGDFYTYAPYGMALRQGDGAFRGVVNAGLMELIETGKYFELFDKWFGPKGEVPYPLTPETRRFLIMQVVPK